MGHGVIVVASSRLLNLGCATGHHPFLMPSSSANLAVVQLDSEPGAAALCFAEVLDGTTAYKNVVYRSPKQLDWKIATSHLPALSAHSPSLPRNMQIRHVSKYMKQMKNAFNESSLRDGEVMMLSALYVAVSACPHGYMGQLAHESLSYTFVLFDDIHGHSSFTLLPYRHTVGHHRFVFTGRVGTLTFRATSAIHDVEVAAVFLAMCIHREDCGSFVYMVDMIVAAAQHEKIVRFSFSVRGRQIIIQRILFER